MRNSTGLLSLIWNRWLKPPTRNKMYRVATYHDVQKQAGEIGGQIFAGTSGHKQSFFWMPDHQTSPKLGEWVYMRYEADRAGNVSKVVSHIHYPVTRNTDGSITIKKYYGLSDITGQADYRHHDLDESELQDLYVSALSFRQKLAKSWSIPLPKQTA